MNLSEYLEGLRTCPDDMIDGESVLSKRFGVCDNYDIMLNAKFGVVVEDFCSLRGTFAVKDFRGLNCFLDYSPKVVGVDISRNRLKSREIFREHPVLVRLHPRHFGEKTSSEYLVLEQHRNIAEVIQMIGRYVQVEKIPALFRGSYLLIPEDILEGRSAVVYAPEGGRYG